MTSLSPDSRSAPNNFSLINSTFQELSCVDFNASNPNFPSGNCSRTNATTPWQRSSDNVTQSVFSQEIFEDILFIDYLGSIFHVILGCISLVLNGFIAFFFWNDRQLSLHDIIQINLCASDLLDGVLGSFLLILARFLMSNDLEVGLKPYYINGLILIISISIENITTILITVVRTTQVCCGCWQLASFVFDLEIEEY